MSRPTSTTAPGSDLEPLLQKLVASDALTAHQARLLMANTEPLEDLWANPYLRSVREHSRAYIEHLLFGGFGAAPRPSSDREI